MGLGDYEIKDKRVLDGQCFYMPIERIFDQRAFIDITGRIEAGTIRAGAQLFLIGLDEDSEKNVGPQAPINIDKVKMFRKVVPKAYATDNVGLEVRGVDHDLLETGKVLAEAGCLEAQNEFKATVYLSLPAQGGRTSAIQVGHKAQFRFHQININGTIENISGASTGKPGEISTIRVKLDRNPALKQGLRFSMRMNGRHLGFGIVE
jgi:translation elongation factor EF-Tu-like GTPase